MKSQSVPFQWSALNRGLVPFPLQEFRASYSSGQLQLASARARPGGATTGKLDASPFSSTVSAGLAPAERRLASYTARQIS